MFIIYTIQCNNSSLNINFGFYNIYKRCSKILNELDCNRSDILYNVYKYGFEYYSKLLNSSDCKICSSYIKHSHFRIYKHKIFTHRSYSSIKYIKDEIYTNDLYLTKEIQKWIYNNQHPLNCSNRKYLIIPYWSCGLGSQIHVMGSYLALAINTNRIAIINRTEISRYFLPLTQCEVYINYSVINKSRDAYSNENIVFPIKYPRMEIPYIVYNLLNKSSISPEFYLHYWRIQASKYIYHLKKQTIKSVNKIISNYKKYSKMNNKMNMYPCINVWIRHGDKYREMKLIETNKYFSAIELFKRLSNIKFHIYLSTDDRNVINEFIKSNYSVYYLNYSRRNDDNNNWKKDHIFNVISDINLSLECIAFIGTRKSNINRLIDELRSTSDTNSNIPYFEIGTIQKTNIYSNNIEITEFW